MRQHFPGEDVPEEPTLQDVLDKIGDLEGMLGNALDAIISLKNSVDQIKRQIADLPGERER